MTGHLAISATGSLVMLAGLGELGLEQVELDATVEAMLFSEVARCEAVPMTWTTWCTQVESVAAAAKSRFPSDPAVHEAVDRTVETMKSSAYLEEQRDATQAEYDAYARYGGMQDEVGEGTRLERLQAELERLEVLAAGAKATEARVELGASEAGDAAIEAAIRDNLIGDAGRSRR